MSLKEFDAEDVGLLVLTVFSAAVMVEIATLEVFAISMSDTWAIASRDVSLAFLVSTATFVGTLATNDGITLSGDLLSDLEEDLEREYYLAVLAAAGLLVAWIAFPDMVQDFFRSNDAYGLAYVALLTAAQLIVGWML